MHGTTVPSLAAGTTDCLPAPPVFLRPTFPFYWGRHAGPVRSDTLILITAVHIGTARRGNLREGSLKFTSLGAFLFLFLRKRWCCISLLKQNTDKVDRPTKSPNTHDKRFYPNVYQLVYSTSTALDREEKWNCKLKVRRVPEETYSVHTGVSGKRGRSDRQF
jgi:hypothetical protein